MASSPPTESCESLDAAYGAAVAAHGVDSEEALEALMNWRIQCSDDPDAYPQSGGHGGGGDPPGG